MDPYIGFLLYTGDFPNMCLQVSSNFFFFFRGLTYFEFTDSRPLTYLTQYLYVTL